MNIYTMGGHKSSLYFLYLLKIIQMLLSYKMLAIMFLVTMLNSKVSAHAIMTLPNQRGTLRKSDVAPYEVDKDAPIDYQAHFPAGSKSGVPGSGRRSQIREIAPRLWTPFTPLDSKFRWRAGVCGDLRNGPQEHRRGGKFYHGGLISRTYRQGGIIEVGMTVVAHHNGFIELHVCNVKHCGGEISESCFRQGFCKQLLRQRDADCETRRNRKCGPIDPKYPGRWYLPCTTVPENKFEMFGPKSIKYRLPPGLVCEHCVLQWFYNTGNNCNAPGVIDYFDGPRGPLWGTCKGQANAVGGVSRVIQTCGTSRDKFPEEYLQCADIRILKRS